MRASASSRITSGAVLWRVAARGLFAATGLGQFLVHLGGLPMSQDSLSVTGFGVDLGLFGALPGPVGLGGGCLGLLHHRTARLILCPGPGQLPDPLPGSFSPVDGLTAA